MKAHRFLFVLALVVPLAGATHVLGTEDYPPGASTTTASALMGQVAAAATYMGPNPQSLFNQIDNSLAPGYYYVAVKGQCTSGTTAQNFRIARNYVENNSGSAALVLELTRTVSNSTLWKSTQAASYIDDYGVTYAAFNGTTTTFSYHVWFHVATTIPGFYAGVSFSGCAAGSGRAYQNDQASDCGAYTGYAGARTRLGGVDVACVISLSSAFAPSAPTLTASAGDQSVLLSWTASAGADYYLVFNDTVSHPGAVDASQYWPLANITAPATTYLHSGLVNGVPQYYRVRAINGSTLAGSLSNEATATPWSAPTLEGRGFREMAFLEWDSGGWSDPLNFFLYRGNSSSNLTLYQTLSGESRDYRDTLVLGDNFYYAVRVANATNTSAYSNVVNIPYVAPPPPLFGDDGVVYGQDGKAVLADTLSISATALDFLYGLFFVVGLAITGFGVTRPFSLELYGSTVGAIVGVFLAMGFQFWPVWAVVFVLAVGLAFYFMVWRQ